MVIEVAGVTALADRALEFDAPAGPASPKAKPVSIIVAVEAATIGRNLLGRKSLIPSLSCEFSL